MGACFALVAVGMILVGRSVAAYQAGTPAQPLPVPSVTGSAPDKASDSPPPSQREHQLAEGGGSQSLGGSQRQANTGGDTLRATADRAWVRKIAEDTGIPERALAAYTEASIRVTEEYPECGLGWNTLAGIGSVESDHGRLFGGSLDEHGNVHPPIYGIPLRGEGTAAIPDTDSGALDGDTTWDRAVGPMQFIPGTWFEWGIDGNGDDVVDPQNIDDSAFAAARYLCAVGGDLTDPDRWIAAIAAYNNTIEYNNRVAEAASFYARIAAQ